MLGHHIRHAVRALASRPGVAATAIAILTLGIGAATTIFSIVDAVMLRALPFHDPARLAVIWETSRDEGLPQMFASPPNYADWAARSRSFAWMGAFSPQELTIAVAGSDPEYVSGARISASLLTTLGVSPMLGRPFRDDEDRPDAAPVALVSAEWWHRRLGSDPGALGRTALIDGVPRAIVGVLPAGAMVPPAIGLFGRPPAIRADVLVPFGIDYRAAQRGAHFMTVIARLKPGVSTDAGDRELKGVAAQLALENPASNRAWSTLAVPLDTQVTGASRPALLLLAGAVGLLLLLACANVASLLVATAIRRAREFAIRAAIGASTRQLAAQMLAEGFAIALAGAWGGVGFAAMATRLVRRLGADRVPRLADASVDWRVALFAICAACAAAMLFSLAPLVQLRRSTGHVRLAATAVATVAGIRVQHVLVAAEVALSVTLLVGASLLAQSFLRLRDVDPGFRPANVLTFSVTLPAARYPDRPARIRLVGAALERLRTTSGIVAAGAVDAAPFVNDRQGTGFALEGESLAAAGASRRTNFSLVGPGYFRALGVPIVGGRVLDDRDRVDAPPVVVINEVLARTFGGAQAALGRRVTLGMNTQSPRTIVGVVANEKNLGLDAEPGPNAYVPYLQLGGSARMTFIVRSAMDAAGAASAARNTIHAIDPAVPLFDVRTMEESMSRATARPRLIAQLLTSFAVAALLLAAVGIFGVMSQTVAQQTREIGIRVAIGADPRRILGLVLGHAARLTAIGLLPGLAAALAAGRLASGLLFGISGTDARTFAFVAATMMAVAGLAALLPAIRAVRVDPITALHAD